MRNYDEAKCVSSINTNPNVQVTLSNKLIEVIKNPTNFPIGNTTWGKIDFLCHYCGYTLCMVSKLVNKKLYNVRKYRDNDDEEVASNKFNMAKMVKNAMKNARRNGRN